MSPGLLLIVLAFIVLYFVMVRPQKRRQLAAQRMLQDLVVGDQVLTAAGIYGEVTTLLDDTDVLVRIAPDVEVRVARRAIGAVLRDEEQAEDDHEELESPAEPDQTGPTPGT
jgi:preprotein translocase subunit YajC